MRTAGPEAACRWQPNIRNKPTVKIDPLDTRRPFGLRWADRLLSKGLPLVQVFRVAPELSSRCCTWHLFRMPCAGAFGVLLFALRRKHVVIHSHDHRDEDDGVVEQMKLDPGNPQLREAGRDRRMKPIMARNCLVLQNAMLNVVPELDPERDHPPGVGNPGETLPQDPQADKHDQGIAVMQRLRLYEPGVYEPQHTQRLWTRPMHYIDLVGLKEMFPPMGDDDGHESQQRGLVPAGVELFIKSSVLR